jgi:ribose 5-phosphate isomerase B
MTANKHKNIRAAICWSEEIAAQSRTHNNANVICIPSRFISKEKQKKIIDIFLSKKFEGGRHANRVSKINC